MYIDIYRLASEEEMLQRLAIAAADVARDVFVEDPATANHDVRLLLVTHAGPRSADFRRFAEEVALLLLLLNPTLTLASPDADLKTALAALWTVYAMILQTKGLL